MTTQNRSDRNELAPGAANPAEQAGQARGRAGRRGVAREAADQGRWLTAILRPAGSLDRAALRGLTESLGHLAASSNMIIVDLSAAVVRRPGAFARDLLVPARTFERAGQCLLLLGASPELTAALDRTRCRWSRRRRRAPSRGSLTVAADRRLRRR